ncbi:MAG: hypothetical protein AB8H12_22780 [Lewinella sp.]
MQSSKSGTLSAADSVCDVAFSSAISWSPAILVGRFRVQIQQYFFNIK